MDRSNARCRSAPPLKERPNAHFENHRPEMGIKSDRLKPNDAMKILADYERGLQAYTCLSLDGPAASSGTVPQVTPAAPA